jgi:hypothetical protein
MYDVELSVLLPGVKKPRSSPRNALLFTHKGYSGPSVGVGVGPYRVALSALQRVLLAEQPSALLA